MITQNLDKDAKLKHIIEQSQGIDKDERKAIADLAIDILLTGKNIAGSLESALEQATSIRADYLAFVNGKVPIN